MTWVSERSGSASSGMFRIVQAESARTTTTPAMTRYLFSAEKRMIRLIIYLPPIAAREARRRDSESTRKLARVTTCSPAESPPATSTKSAPVAATFTSRGWNLPSPTATNTTFFVPESMTASAGMRRPSRAGACSITSPNISGRSSPVGLGKASLTLAVRVFGSSRGVDEDDLPLEGPVGERLQRERRRHPEPQPREIRLVGVGEHPHLAEVGDLVGHVALLEAVTHDDVLLRDDARHRRVQREGLLRAPGLLEPIDLRVGDVPQLEPLPRRLDEVVARARGARRASQRLPRAERDRKSTRL